MNLLEQLEARGVAVTEDAGVLNVHAPRGLARDIRLVLIEHKDEVLHILWLREWLAYLAERPARDSDPRDDLAADTIAWSRLLRLAYAQGDDLGPTLKGFRAMGAGLAFSLGNWRLTQGEISAEDYAEWRAAYLLPVGRRVMALLDALGGGDVP